MSDLYFIRFDLFYCVFREAKRFVLPLTVNKFTLSGNDNKAKHLSSLRPCLHGERKILEDETTLRLGYMKFQSGRLTSEEGKEENCRPLAAERRPPPCTFLLFVCVFFLLLLLFYFFLTVSGAIKHCLLYLPLRS